MRSLARTETDRPSVWDDRMRGAVDSIRLVAIHVVSVEMIPFVDVLGVISAIYIVFFLVLLLVFVVVILFGFCFI